MILSNLIIDHPFQLKLLPACLKGLVNLVLPEVKRFLLHTGEHYENRYSLYTLMETDSASCLSSSETLKDLKKILEVM